MKDDLKNNWTAALRSGNFKQTDGALKNCDGYCCLGVLCEILAPGYLKPIYQESEEGYNPTSSNWTEYKFDLPHDMFDADVTSIGELDETLCRKIGLGTQVMQDLISMNDGGKDFKTIADYIDSLETLENPDDPDYYEEEYDYDESSY